MKLLFSIIIASALYVNDRNLYDINFENINGTITEMKTLSEKRVLVLVVNAAAPDINWVLLVDSVAHVDTLASKLIVIPALDLLPDLQKVSADTLSVRFAGLIERGIIVSKPSLVKVSAKASQHRLLKWLTDVNENRHFDVHEVKEGQLFMINERGILYGVHARKFNAGPLRNTMTQTVSQ